MQELLIRSLDMAKSKQPSDFCKEYLKRRELFRWFIEKYYGLKKYVDLMNLAEENEEDQLRHELNNMWFELPDNVFNIQNNPPGWESFLDLIDE